MYTQIIPQVEHVNWLWGWGFLNFWRFRVRYSFWFNSLLSDHINRFVITEYCLRTRDISNSCFV